MKIQPSTLEQLSEQWFASQREELAACLAAGEAIHAGGSTLLTFEDVEGVLYPDMAEEVRAAMMLCAEKPELGGKHMRNLLRGVALGLIDTFQDGIRADYESDINGSEAA